ncbi:hypothetical protein [Streptomyces sp. NPDC054794]
MGIGGLEEYHRREAARNLFRQHLSEECAGLQLHAEGQAALPYLQMAIAAVIDALDPSTTEELLRHAGEAWTQDRDEEQHGGLGTRLLILTTPTPTETTTLPYVAAQAGMRMVANLAECCPDLPLDKFLSCARRALRQTTAFSQ